MVELAWHKGKAFHRLDGVEPSGPPCRDLPQVWGKALGLLGFSSWQWLVVDRSPTSCDRALQTWPPCPARLTQVLLTQDPRVYCQNQCSRCPPFLAASARASGMLQQSARSPTPDPVWEALCLEFEHLDSQSNPDGPASWEHRTSRPQGQSCPRFRRL